MSGNFSAVHDLTTRFLPGNYKAQLLIVQLETMNCWGNCCNAT